METAFWVARAPGAHTGARSASRNRTVSREHRKVRKTCRKTASCTTRIPGMHMDAESAGRDPGEAEGVPRTLETRMKTASCAAHHPPSPASVKPTRLRRARQDTVPLSKDPRKSAERAGKRSALHAPLELTRAGGAPHGTLRDPENPKKHMETCRKTAFCATRIPGSHANA